MHILNTVVREGLSSMNSSRNQKDNKERTRRRSEESVSDGGKTRCKGPGVKRLSRLEQGVHKVFVKSQIANILGFVGPLSLLQLFNSAVIC